MFDTRRKLKLVAFSDGSRYFDFGGVHNPIIKYFGNLAYIKSADLGIPVVKVGYLSICLGI